MIGIYRYKIRLQYIINDEEYIIDYKNIHNLLIDYDYDKKNRPVLFATISIDKNILDHMIENSKNNTINLTISKYNTTTGMYIEEDYIKGEFIYFLPDNLNYNKSLDYTGVERGTEDKFKPVTLGLMMKRLIDDNKIMINDIVKDTSMINIIYKHMSHMNVLIEPLKHTDILKRFIIPPLTTISNFIKYIDDYYSLYDTNYRLFFDHDKTYLISSKGDSVKSQEEDYFSVIININNTVGSESKYQGMTVDNFTNSYVIDVDANDTEVFKDEDTVRSKNIIIGVDNDGNTRKSIIDEEESTDKISVERINNNNLNKVDLAVKELKNSTIINIIKSDLDTSAITINKQYLIKNYIDLRENDGKYLLIRKREIFTREGDEFVVTNLLTMKKIGS